MSSMTTKVIIVMGVCGAGKSTFGSALAASLGWRFEDADDHHSPENRDKMAAGVALTDEDREPWLAALARLVDQALRDEAGLVLACSALREQYRARLGVGRPGVALIHLTAPPDVLSVRLTTRAGHFMPASLLDSQLRTLEPPHAALELVTTVPVPELVRKARAVLV